MTYHFYACFSHISLIHSLHSWKSVVLKAVHLDLFFPRLRLKGRGLVLYRFVSVAQSCTVCRACCGWHLTRGVSSAVLQHACGLEELSEWDRKRYYNTTEFWHNLACKQALQGALVAGREKIGEPGTSSLEFEWLHPKCRSQMLIGGDDISNDVITLGACFHVFFNVFFTFAFVSALRWLAKIWQLSWRGVTGELEAEFKFQRRCKLQAFLPFPTPPLERPKELARRLNLTLEVPRATGSNKVSGKLPTYPSPKAITLPKVRSKC